jgi:hypothetical protein
MKQAHVIANTADSSKQKGYVAAQWMRKNYISLGSQLMLLHDTMLRNLSSRGDSFSFSVGAAIFLHEISSNLFLDKEVTHT